MSFGRMHGILDATTAKGHSMRWFATNGSASRADGGNPRAAVDRSVVLVTGANRGIGHATATLLADHGYQVFGTARKPAEASSDRFRVLPLDVTSERSVRSCVQAVLDRAGRIDVLVNNAAVGLIGAIEETSIEEVTTLFDTNLFGVARMVNAVLPAMRERRTGLIINFGSLAATLPIPFHAYLSASKAAIITYSDALRLELAGLGIEVAVIEPGMIATHPGERFAALKVANSIDDYAEPQRRATAVIEHGQSAGAEPRIVGETVLKIIRSKAPSPHYLVGRERWLLRLSKILPASTVESLAARHFQLPR
jgi:short-subunit dehydrogenase